MQKIKNRKENAEPIKAEKKMQKKKGRKMQVLK